MKNDKKHLFAVILAGGSGTRLWPLSRELYPKQLLKLTGNKTLIQQTFLRVKKAVLPKNIFVVAGENIADDIYVQLRVLGINKENIIKEPGQKNTAAAIALASKIIFNKDKNAKILISPSDHIIGPDSEFLKTAGKAFNIAESGLLVTFGIIPLNPNVEYGYIKINLKSQISNLKNKAYKVEKFIEKPDIKLAEKLIKQGAFWNSGIFVLKAEMIIEEIKKFLPNVYEAIDFYGNNFDNFLELYRSLKQISIDKGILEKSEKIVVIPAKFKWKDIGSWKTLHEFLPKDSQFNILNEQVLANDCSGCLIYGHEKRVIAAFGLKDLVVVDTEDAVLVSHKDHTHKIKKAVEEMKRKNINQYSQHPTSYRPWGKYTILEEGKNFKVKKIVVEPRQKLSLQFHKKRAEHWTVLRGSAKVELNGKIFNLKPYQNINIPVFFKHSLENPGKKSLEIIEIQSGKYLGEDDIVRIDDKYGRN